MGTKEVYELLCILDFNNIRKRMSVILRKDGKLTLYCKGADNVIYERLKSGQDEVRTKTQDHLNVSINIFLVFFLPVMLYFRNLLEKVLERSVWHIAI